MGCIWVVGSVVEVEFVMSLVGFRLGVESVLALLVYAWTIGLVMWVVS